MKSEPASVLANKNTNSRTIKWHLDASVFHRCPNTNHFHCFCHIYCCVVVFVFTFSYFFYCHHLCFQTVQTKESVFVVAGPVYMFSVCVLLSFIYSSLFTFAYSVHMIIYCIFMCAIIMQSWWPNGATDTCSFVHTWAATMQTPLQTRILP